MIVSVGNEGLEEIRMVGVRGQGRRFDTQAALDSAMDVFWRHGYEGASVADLTGAMGISASSLYAAFGGKKELFSTVVSHYLETKGRFTSVAFEEETGSLPLLRRLLHEAPNEYADGDGPGGCLIVSAATCVSEENADIEEKLEAHRRSNIEQIEDLLRADRANGVVADDVDPEALAGFVGAVMQGMAQRGRDGASSEELSATAKMALNQVEQSLRLS